MARAGLNPMHEPPAPPQLVQAGVRAAECMRAHGLPNDADPTANTPYTPGHGFGLGAGEVPAGGKLSHGFQQAIARLPGGWTPRRSALRPCPAWARTADVRARWLAAAGTVVAGGAAAGLIVATSRARGRVGTRGVRVQRRRAGQRGRGRLPRGHRAGGPHRPDQHGPGERVARVRGLVHRRQPDAGHRLHGAAPAGTGGAPGPPPVRGGREPGHPVLRAPARMAGPVPGGHARAGRGAAGHQPDRARLRDPRHADRERHVHGRDLLRGTAVAGRAGRDRDRRGPGRAGRLRTRPAAGGLAGRHAGRRGAARGGRAGRHVGRGRWSARHCRSARSTWSTGATRSASRCRTAPGPCPASSPRSRGWPARRRPAARGSRHPGPSAPGAGPGQAGADRAGGSSDTVAGHRPARPPAGRAGWTRPRSR